jgi:hypothetical protein
MRVAEHDARDNQSSMSDPVQSSMSDPADDFGAWKRPAALPHLTTPEQLRRPSLPQQRLGGYSREAVDQVLGGAAQTVEKLLSEIKASQDEIARLESSQADREQQLELAQRRSPEEIVGEVLMTAQRAAESLIEKARQDAAWAVTEARRETAPVLAEAQRALEEAGRLHRDAQATIAQARLQAAALVESTWAQRERLIADTVADAERRRGELEADNVRLETAITSLRSEWAARATEALARLDGIALMAGPPQEEPHSIDASAGEGQKKIDSGADEPGSFNGEGVVRDLHARLPESQAAEPSPPDFFG